MPPKVHHKKKSEMRGTLPRYYPTIPNPCNHPCNQSNNQCNNNQCNNPCNNSQSNNQCNNPCNNNQCNNPCNNSQSNNQCNNSQSNNQCNNSQCNNNPCNNSQSNNNPCNIRNNMSCDMSINYCKYSPYTCINYRNMSLWCENCMSRRLFPENYPHDPNLRMNFQPPCADLYVNGHYVMPPSCPNPVSCPISSVSHSCPAPQN